MTTGNAVTPANNGQQQPAPAADAPAQAGDQVAQQTPELVDPDDIELRDALAAAKAEEAGGEDPGDGAAPAGTDGQQQQQQPTGQQQPEGQQQAGQPAKVMVPKERLDEVLGEKTKAENDAAYWRGQAEARGAKAPAAGEQTGQQPQGPTTDEQLKAIHTEQDALAAKFDAGEISMADFKKSERELNAKEAAIREEALLAKVKPAAPTDAAGELYLDTLTSELEAKHPWVKIADQVGTDADWDYVNALAKQNLVDRGIDPTKGAIGTYHLRQEMAALFDELGPQLLTKRAQAKGIALPGQSQQQQQPPAEQQQQPAGAKPQSQNAQNRTAKLALQRTAPPSITNLGTTGSAAPGEVSDAQLEAMDEDAIGNLPNAVRAKLRGAA